MWTDRSRTVAELAEDLFLRRIGSSRTKNRINSLRSAILDFSPLTPALRSSARGQTGSRAKERSQSEARMTRIFRSPSCERRARMKFYALQTRFSGIRDCSCPSPPANRGRTPADSTRLCQFARSRLKDHCGCRSRFVGRIAIDRRLGGRSASPGRLTRVRQASSWLSRPELSLRSLVFRGAWQLGTTRYHDKFPLCFESYTGNHRFR